MTGSTSNSLVYSLLSDCTICSEQAICHKMSPNCSRSSALSECGPSQFLATHNELTRSALWQCLSLEDPCLQGKGMLSTTSSRPLHS